MIHIKHIFNNHCPYSGKLTTQPGLYIFIWFHATEKFFAFKTLLQKKKYELYDLFVNNSNIVLSKKEYSKLITKKIWTEEEKQWRASLSDMYFYSKIHTKLSPCKLWVIDKEDLSEMLFIKFLVQVSCRDNILENILEI